jgi:glycosyltransferase involved in cell wall biosynthesis
MEKIKATLVIVVLNEERDINLLLNSIEIQSRKPDEIIFVDGGSKDNTLSMIRKHQIFKRKNIHLIIKKGNIPVGRNEGIRRSKGEIIAFTDAGCILEKRWFENIVKPIFEKRADVAAGYYKGKTNSVFEKCMVPYVLVMPDRINENDFLPAARSMAVKKNVFEKYGLFREDLDHAEDYEFAIRIKRMNVKINFQQLAIVSWIPRENIKDAFIMFYCLSKGDSQARIVRTKVIFIFLRYLIFFVFLVFFMFFNELIVLGSLLIAFFMYFIWSIQKNYKYVEDLQAIFYLPLIQIVSDIAVMIGTIRGIIPKMDR